MPGQVITGIFMGSIFASAHLGITSHSSQLSLAIFLWVGA